jgi:hypothetical protein
VGLSETRVEVEETDEKNRTETSPRRNWLNICSNFQLTHSGPATRWLLQPFRLLCCAVLCSRKKQREERQRKIPFPVLSCLTSFVPPHYHISLSPTAKSRSYRDVRAPPALPCYPPEDWPRSIYSGIPGYRWALGSHHLRKGSG